MAKWEDAYRPGEHSGEQLGGEPSDDPSIHQEPHVRDGEFVLDPSERVAGQELDPLGGQPTLDDEVEATVWEEPGLSAQLAGGPDADAMTYQRWLDIGERETSWTTSWWVCWGVALLSGPAAVVGTLLSQNISGIPMIVVVGLVGPLAEEIMKAAAILWIVEKRPYLFKSGVQILVCAAASGFMFAVIENVIYLTAYVPNPPAGLVAWRWTVCVLLHTTCTLVSGMGLRRVWWRTIRDRVRPKMTLAASFVMTAVAIHAVYNIAAMIFEGLGGLF